MVTTYLTLQPLFEHSQSRPGVRGPCLYKIHIKDLSDLNDIILNSDPFSTSRQERLYTTPANSRSYYQPRSEYLNSHSLPEGREYPIGGLEVRAGTSPLLAKSPPKLSTPVRRNTSGNIESRRILQLSFFVWHSCPSNNHNGPTSQNHARSLRLIYSRILRIHRKAKRIPRAERHPFRSRTQGRRKAHRPAATVQSGGRPGGL